MKKISYLLIGLFSLLILVSSCSKDEKDPVLNTEQITAPAFTNPSNGEAYILLEDNAENVLTTFKWSPTSYNLNDLATTTYKLEMAKTGTDFAEAVFLQNTTETEISYTVAGMNTLLIANGFAADEVANVSFRITSNITSNNTAEMKMSTPIDLAITPFSQEINYKPLYLVGGGTEAGWDNTQGLEMPHISEGKFGIVTNLTAGQGMKILSMLGLWAPQWGTDDTGTGEGGVLIYRPDESVTDPAEIPTPDTDGLYRIVADTANLTYEIYAAPTNLYLLGDASAAGWDNTAALLMNNDGDGKFSITTDLTAADIKFVEVLGQWAPQWGAAEGASGLKGNISFRPTESDPDPANIGVPAEGTYTIEVDLAAQTYKLLPQ